jgi:hypothetical protein
VWWDKVEINYLANAGTIIQNGTTYSLPRGRRSESLRHRLLPPIDGYHKCEAESGIRWTDGDAAVPAEPLFGIGGPCMLTLHLGAATQYIDDGTVLTSRIA